MIYNYQYLYNNVTLMNNYKLTSKHLKFISHDSMLNSYLLMFSVFTLQLLLLIVTGAILNLYR